MELNKFTKRKKMNSTHRHNSSTSTRERSFVDRLMMKFSHHLHRDATPNSTLKAIIFLFTCAFGFNYLGILDFIFEIDYVEFRWPYDHVDIFRQVQLWRNDEQMEYLPVFTRDDLKFLTTPKDMEIVCGQTGLPLVLILVKSNPANQDRRQFVRKWWNEQENLIKKNWKYRFALYFLTGTPLETSTFQALQQELSQNQDLIQSNFIDTIRNRTLATIAAMKWSYEECSNKASYNFLISDTYRISIQNLIDFLDQKSIGKNPLVYTGYLHEKTKVDRHNFGKNSLSLSEYPYTHFPPYIDSSAVLLSREVMELMYLGSQYVKIFEFEDVYVGILAKLLTIPAQHSDRFAICTNRLCRGMRLEDLDWTKIIVGPAFLISDKH